MAISPWRVGKSYERNALCQACNIRYKASDLKMRWDRLWVCPDDYELRHPLDFFRTRNDTHKLDFILSDTPADPRSTYIPTISNITVQQLEGETKTTILLGVSPTGYYLANSFTGLTSVEVDLPFYKPSFSDASTLLPVLNATSTTSGSGATITMPTVPTTAGNFTIINDRGEVIKTGTVPAGNVTVTLGSWNVKRGGLVITATYGT